MYWALFTSTSQGWSLHTKPLAVPHRTNPGRRNNWTTLNLLVPCCKRTSLTGCFCLLLFWHEDHVLISICCTSTIHLHAHPQGKHSTDCANRTDPCRKAPAFSVPSDGAYRAYTLRRSWTWLICKVGARTRLRTHGTFGNTTVKKAPDAFHWFPSEAWKLQKEKEMLHHQVYIGQLSAFFSKERFPISARSACLHYRVKSATQRVLLPAFCWQH